MKTFHIEKTMNSEYPFIVFSTSYQSPLSSFLEIQRETVFDGFNGEIIFDLLLSNGFSSNRFLVIPFHDGKLDVHTVKILSDIPIEILQFCGDFHALHPEYVNRSSLLKREVDMILFSR